MSYAKTPGQIAFDRWHAGRVSSIDGRKVTWESLDDSSRAVWERTATRQKPLWIYNLHADIERAVSAASFVAVPEKAHEVRPCARTKAALEAECKSPGQVLREHECITFSVPTWDTLNDEQRNGWENAARMRDAAERTNAKKTPGQMEFEKRAAPGYSWDALPPEAKEKWEKLASTLGVFAAKPVIAVPVGRYGERRDDIAEFAWKHSRRRKGLFNPRLGPTPRRPATVFDGGDICAAMAATVQQTASHITGTRTVYLDTAPGEAEMRAFEKEAKVSGVIFGMDLADGPDCTMAMLMTSAGIAQAFHVLLGSTKNENR